MNKETGKHIDRANAWFQEREMKRRRKAALRVFLIRVAFASAIAVLTVYGSWIHLSGMNIIQFLRQL